MKTLTPFGNQFDEMFDRLIGTAAQNPASRVIPIDVVETDGHYVVRATLPGVEPNAINVTVENNVLTIRGERQAEDESREARVYRRENVYGTFARSLRLGERLDTDSVRADYRHGILTLTINRIPEEKPRTITVNVKDTLAGANPVISAELIETTTPESSQS